MTSRGQKMWNAKVSADVERVFIEFQEEFSISFTSLAHDVIAEAKCHIPDGFFDVWNIILGEKLPKTPIQPFWISLICCNMLIYIELEKQEVMIQFDSKIFWYSGNSQKVKLSHWNHCQMHWWPFMTPNLGWIMSKWHLGRVKGCKNRTNQVGLKCLDNIFHFFISKIISHILHGHFKIWYMPVR